MAENGSPQQPAPPNMGVPLATQCGFQQIGDKMHVVINMGTAGHATTLVLEVEQAKIFSRQIKETAEQAEVQVLKPPAGGGRIALA